QGCPLVVQGPLRELVLVLTGSGDRAGPTRRRLSRERLLARSPLVVLRFDATETHTRSEVRAGVVPEVLADLAQYLNVTIGQAQAVPDTRTRGRGHRERGRDRAQL